MQNTTTLKLFPLALLTACGAVVSEPSSEDTGIPESNTIDFEDVGVDPSMPEQPAPE